MSEVVDSQSIPAELIEPDMPQVFEVVAENEAATHEVTKNMMIKKWLPRLAIGAAVIGGGVALATSPLEEVKNDVVTAAPWTAGGLAVTEGLWIGGAGLALAGAGRKVGNPLTIHKRADGMLKGVGEATLTSPNFRAGIKINTLGAIGSAGVVMAGAVAALPPETWPGAIGLASLDMAGTVALRAPLYRGMKKVEEGEKLSKVHVRHAQLEDIDRLADLDLELFEGAYGEELPKKENVVDMLTTRFHNAKGWMFVAEMDGKVEGFVTAFRTNKSKKDFISWEDTTANGTLEGKVDPGGKYVYVINMTIARKAVKQGAKDMLLANVFANAMHEEGIEYGYFESRMPMFREWLEKTDQLTDDPVELHKLAEQYVEMPAEDGKLYDKQLRMYQEDGFTHGTPVAGAFADAASMDYGVVFSTPNPAGSKFFQAIPPARWAFASAVRSVAKHPKLLAKVL
jgi:hypothetical protein